MSFTCLDPYVAISMFTKLDGKRILKLFSKSRLNYDLNELKERYGQDNVFLLSCGKCESCRRNKAEDWAIRCELEAQMYPFNYFLTLTFDDQHIFNGSKYDLDSFLDRLEGTNHQNKFKYFACQELGELTERLHFHVILFCDFEIDLIDPVKLGGFYHYHSKLIGEKWTYGLHDIAPFKTNCARYVAKYTSKGSKLYMSRNLGKDYFLKYKDEIIKNNFKVYGDFGGRYSAHVPSCFIKWFDELDPTIAEDYKKVKKDLAHYVQAENKRALIAEHDEQELRQRQQRVIEKGNRKKRL